MEMKYLATGTGEIIGGIKVASIIATDYGIWAARARNVVLKSKKMNDDEKLEICEKLANALAKKDIRTILIIYEAISKVIQKMAKMASQRAAKGRLNLLPAR